MANHNQTVSSGGHTYYLSNTGAWVEENPSQAPAYSQYESISFCQVSDSGNSVNCDKQITVKQNNQQETYTVTTTAPIVRTNFETFWNGWTNFAGLVLLFALAIFLVVGLVKTVAKAWSVDEVSERVEEVNRDVNVLKSKLKKKK